MAKLKVLFILHLPPPIHGAAVMGGLISNSNLINHEFKTSYINLGSSKEINSIGKISLQKYVRILLVFFQVLFKLVVFRPNLVYLTPSSKGIAVYRDSLITLILKMLKLPVVSHLHNKGVIEFGISRFNNLILSILFNKVNIMLLSERLKSEFLTVASESSFLICPNGLPDSANRLQWDSRSDLGPIRFLFFSNLFESKGVIVLLESLKLLKMRSTDFVCTIAGQQGDLSSDYLLGLIKEFGLQHNVILDGPKFGLEKNKLFIDSDVFVHPTLDDCFPLVLLEALMFSMPIVATVEGGIPDIVDGESIGFLVDKLAPDQLADKLLIFINDRELLSKMKLNARGKFEENFTVQIFEKRFINALNSIKIER